jgi:hypothetical protein
MDIDFLVGGIFAVASILAFFGGIALLMWVDHRGKATQRQLEHQERLRALEVGHELPDAAVARATASGSRAWAAAIVGFLVPPAVLSAAVGATALILVQAPEHIHLPILCTIWGVCGLVSVVAVSSSLAALKQQNRREPSPTEPHAPATKPARAQPPLEARQIDLDIVAQDK